MGNDIGTIALNGRIKKLMNSLIGSFEEGAYTLTIEEVNALNEYKPENAVIKNYFINECKIQHISVDNCEKCSGNLDELIRYKEDGETRNGVKKYVRKVIFKCYDCKSLYELEYITAKHLVEKKTKHIKLMSKLTLILNIILSIFGAIIIVAKILDI